MHRRVRLVHNIGTYIYCETEFEAEDDIISLSNLPR